VKFHKAIGTMVLTAFLAALPAVAGNKSFAEGSKLVMPLVPSGTDNSVSGTADFQSSLGKSRLRIKIKDAPAGESLDVLVGGIVRGSVVTRANGSATVQFQAPSVGNGSRPLDFDPRGEIIEIRHGEDGLLKTHDGDGPSPDGTRLDERAPLVATGVQPAASGHARLRERLGVRKFEVEIEDVTDGSYDLLADGTLRGTITTSLGRGDIEFAAGSDDAGVLPLDFDPFGKLIQVSQGGEVVLSGMLLAGAPGVSVCTPGETTSAMGSTGADPDAQGDVRLRIRTDCRRDLRVEIEDLPVGDYELLADGTLRGIIPVATRLDGGTEGEIELSSDPDEAPELPLLFEPSNATFEVRQGATIFLATTVGVPGPGVCSLVEVQPALANAGVEPSAKGKARFRQDLDCDSNFRVEVEDLPVGDYELFVAGLLRGSFTVLLSAGKTTGQIEFETTPSLPGEILLDFDPRGQLVEVRRFGTTVLFSVTMPE